MNVHCNTGYGTLENVPRTLHIVALHIVHIAQSSFLNHLLGLMKEFRAHNAIFQVKYLTRVLRPHTNH